MITEKPPICINCKHFYEGVICPAFNKNGIPDEIIDGSNDHSKPLPGQKNDITFTPLDE